MSEYKYPNTSTRICKAMFLTSPMTSIFIQVLHLGETLVKRKPFDIKIFGTLVQKYDRNFENFLQKYEAKLTQIKLFTW